MSFRLAIEVVLVVTVVAAWADDAVKSTPQDVTFCQLAKDPSSFLGKRIRVRALYVFGFELQMLKSPVCCPVSEQKMGVDFDPAMDDQSEKLFHKLDKGMGFALAVFVGRFERVSNVSSHCHREIGSNSLWRELRRWKNPLGRRDRARTHIGFRGIARYRLRHSRLEARS
jgi:hypothetical protein